MRVLLIEDDRVLGAAIRDYLNTKGHSADWVTLVADARLALATVTYELVLLDLGLPDGSGLDLLQELRGGRHDLPVIITTAQDQVAIRVEGLNSGADDYLVKPFDLSEMLARMSAVVRRFAGSSLPARLPGEVTVDLARRTVVAGDTSVVLTAREWAVLERLIRHRGAIVSKSDIEDSLYQFGAEIESNAVEVYISRLRKKLGRDFVSTSRGLGYQIAQDA